MHFEYTNQTGNSKERREQLKKEIEQIAKDLPFRFEKISQLRNLKAFCTYLKKEKHFSSIKNQTQNLNNIIKYNDNYINQVFTGFITCFTKTGDLVYVSENITDYFGFNAMDVLFAYDNILEMVCKQDIPAYSELLKNYHNYSCGNKFSFFSSWFVSKIQKKQILISDYKQFKISGKYDSKTDLFILNCYPILSINNRDALVSTDFCCFRTIHKLNLQILEYSKNFYDFLGYNFNDIQEINTLYNLLSSDSIDIIVRRHRELLVIKNTRGYNERIKLIHKDGGLIECLLNIYYDPKGFIVCVHQILSKHDMECYISYMSKLENKDNLDIKNEDINFQCLDIYDPNFSNLKIENSFENEFLEKSETNCTTKRKIELNSHDEESYTLKRVKYDDQFDFEQDFITNIDEIKEIFNIEESLKQAFYVNASQNVNDENCQMNSNIQCQIQRVDYNNEQIAFNNQNRLIDQEDFDNDINYLNLEDHVLNSSAFEYESSNGCVFENISNPKIQRYANANEFLFYENYHYIYTPNAIGLASN